jgi:uroporphyrinogen decarboxylase
VDYIEDCISGLIQQLGTQVPVAPLVPSPIDMPLMMLGMEKWLHTFLFEPRKTQQILALTTPYFIQRCNRLFAMGAPFLVTSGIFTNPGVLTRELVQSTAIPFIQKAFSQLDGPVILHSGGKKIAPFLDLLAALPQVAGFVLSSGEDMRHARNKVGEDPVLAGNIDGPTLHQLSAEAIYTRSLALLDEVEEDSRCILCTSGADIRMETSVENIHALLRAAQDHGGIYESS